MAACTVSYRDTEGIEHAVTVTAESLYEAAALGYEALSAAELSDARPGPGSMLEILVHPPPVIHKMPVAKLKRWIDGGGKSPREVALKSRLKERIAL